MFDLINFNIIQRDMVSVIVSLVCGSMMGFEREYQNKSAGFRTIILICLGSTIFSLGSHYALGASQDRIATNILLVLIFLSLIVFSS